MIRPHIPPALRIVEQSPWNRAEAYSPTLAADIREFCKEVADAPAHHAVFGLVTFIATCVLIYGSAWVLVHTVLS